MTTLITLGASSIGGKKGAELLAQARQNEDKSQRSENKAEGSEKYEIPNLNPMDALDPLCQDIVTGRTPTY